MTANQRSAVTLPLGQQPTQHDICLVSVGAPRAVNGVGLPTRREHGL